MKKLSKNGFEKYSFQKQVISILLILLIAFSAVGVALADAPTFDSIGDQIFNEAELNTLSIAPSDVDGDALTLTLTEDSYDSEDSSYRESRDFSYFIDAGDYSSAVQWTPDYADVGDHIFTYTVTDDTGESTSETFTITVISQYVIDLENLELEFAAISSEVEGLVINFNDAIEDDDSEDLEEIYGELEDIIAGFSSFLEEVDDLVHNIDEANDDGELSNEITEDIETGIDDLMLDFTDLLELVETMSDYIESYVGNSIPEFVVMEEMEFLFMEDVAGEAPLLIHDSDADETFTLTGEETSYSSTSSSLDLSDPSVLAMRTSDGLYEAMIYWTPTNDDVGYHYVTITAEDSYGNEITVSVLLYVDGVDDPLEVAAIADQTVSVDVVTGEVETFTYDVEATDEDATSITYNLMSIVSRFSDVVPLRPEPINPIEIDSDGVITWVPDVSEVGVTFTVMVDVYSHPSISHQEFDIEVIADAMPTISGLDSSYSANEGEELTFTFTSTEADGEALSFEITEESFSGTYASSSNIESEAVFASAGSDSYTVTWTPTNDAVGTVTASITVTDESGSSATSDSFTITVADSTTAPNIDAIADQNVAIGDTLDLTITASDPDGGSVALSMSGDLPSDAIFTDNGDGTASLVWTTATGDDADYDVTITAIDSDSESSTATFTVTAGEGTPLSEWEQAIADLQAEFDEIEEEFEDDDLEDEYEDAVDDDDESDIEDAEDDLLDIIDQLEDLLDDLEDVRDDVNEAEEDDDISKSTESDLEDDLDDLEEDINDLIDEIEDILGIESNNGTSATGYLEATSTGDSVDDDRSSNGLEVEVTTFQDEDDGSTATVENTSSFDEIRPLLWLAGGIAIAFALLIFALSMLVTRK